VRLLQPARLGALQLSNRVVMAPMTRSRAGQPGNVANALTAEYYAQRAGAGLIVGEGTQVSDTARGYLFTPGIHTPEQVAGWRLVTDAVHAAGGRIFAQLWHVGRISHTSLQPGGRAPVSSVATVAEGAVAFGLDAAGQPAYLPASPPTALDEAGIQAVVGDFRRATENAMAAGFDGVEIHGANGYLLDQFMNGGLNGRGDAYGGSVEGRARLTLAVVDAAIAVAGAGRVGLRISPHGTFNAMPEDPEADAMAYYLADALDRRDAAYLHVVDPAFNGYGRGSELLLGLKARFRGVLIVCGGMDQAKGEQYLGDGLADLIAFGRPFIANADLPERLRRGVPLAEPDPATFYGGGAEGYTDYPLAAAS
jgi:N-ethylmaleimide reductase